mmetsp:Transcript_75766/g.177813  ORF Transcript_75766/g.177813 Transcript_75766/m.177813 type:complete len:382 (+) Transcript_75766:76-1221(+)
MTIDSLMYLTPASHGAISSGEPAIGPFSAGIALVALQVALDVPLLVVQLMVPHPCCPLTLLTMRDFRRSIPAPWPSPSGVLGAGTCSSASSNKTSSSSKHRSNSTATVGPKRVVVSSRRQTAGKGGRCGGRRSGKLRAEPGATRHPAFARRLSIFVQSGNPKSRLLFLRWPSSAPRLMKALILRSAVAYAKSIRRTSDSLQSPTSASSGHPPWLPCHMRWKTRSSKSSPLMVSAMSSRQTRCWPHLQPHHAASTRGTSSQKRSATSSTFTHVMSHRSTHSVSTRLLRTLQRTSPKTPSTPRRILTWRPPESTVASAGRSCRAKSSAASSTSRVRSRPQGSPRTRRSGTDGCVSPRRRRGRRLETTTTPTCSSCAAPSTPWL